MKCSMCGKKIVSDGIGSGYGNGANGDIFCYDCCAKVEADILDGVAVGEKAYFYLSNKDGKYEVVNWCGTLRIPCDSVKHGRHNFAGTRIDVNFTFRGKRFHATQYGTHGNICTVRRLKDAV